MAEIFARSFLRIETETSIFEIFFPNSQNPEYKIIETKKATPEQPSPSQKKEYSAASMTANAKNFRFHAQHGNEGLKECLHIGPITKPVAIIIETR
jgi:hypothetical protein